jgi:hypothetical protein
MEEVLVRGEDYGQRRRIKRRTPLSILASILRRPFVYWVPFCPFYDRTYALIQFIFTHKRWPRHYLFNDRLVRMKMYGELLDPVRQMLTDKEWVKHYAEALLGPGHVPATYSVLKTKQEVYEYQFPKECVVKPCHSTGQTLLVRDGVVDKKLVASWLDYRLYPKSREQNYAFLRPKIIVEEFVYGSERAPDDYKFYCVDGQPRAIMVIYDRSTNMTGQFYDTDWNAQEYMLLVPVGRTIPRPANLDEMLRVASVLAKGLGFIRVDLYSDGQSVKVGELTNCTGSARDKFYPPEGEHRLSALLFGDEGRA